MNDKLIADATARARALDPTGSFIVQAPAGSGKTELLSRRLLALLARVSRPEEIVALTFTRKAAAEMRGRVLKALQAARSALPEGAKPHQRETWALARAALEADSQRGWRLTHNPSRLRIETIDALCADFANRMPLTSRFAEPPRVLEDPIPLYQEAARATLGELSRSEWSRPVTVLLAHLDNNLPLLEGLLAEMLGKRDQWLRHVAGGGERERLEAGLEAGVIAALAAAAEAAPQALWEEVLALARYCASNLAAVGSNSEICACLGLVAPPGAAAADLIAWLGLARLTLTDKGTWRKLAHTQEGFPAASTARDPEEKTRFKAMKIRFAELGTRLAQEDEFRVRLEALRSLPPTRFDDTNWPVLTALIQLLKLACAHLDLVFRRRGEADFIAVAQAAMQALGEPDAPTDLALALDYRIRHLLIDEFQDTSYTQYTLIERLTTGWEHGDGRTLFLVGDPMQSIYRFREARVGLFLRARAQGIGTVKLTPLHLTVNFRSQQGIVDWVNRTFPQVLPKRENFRTGAVPYHAASAQNAPLPGPAVCIHPFLDKDCAPEAQRVVELVQAAREEETEASVAVLVRSRNHLAVIAPALAAAGLRFQAVGIERLDEAQEVRDLLALTRALCHPADRVAWLAVLRAPWCGLTLSDLCALTDGAPRTIVWELIQDPARLSRLSEDGAERVKRLAGIFTAAFAERGRKPLRRAVEGVWLALGGPACCAAAAHLKNAASFFERLESLDRGGTLEDFAALEREVARLHASPDTDAGPALQLMTVHKAKGLEFDIVIVPGLARKPRQPERQLLAWMERPGGGDAAELLLAPIPAAGSSKDPIYAYLRAEEAHCARLEDARLLYVAATRARRRLHLLANVRQENGRLASPPAQSLLAQLWPVVQAEFQSALAGILPTREGERRDERRSLRRLPLSWRPPFPPDSAVPVPELPLPREEVEFFWAGETAKHVGTVVHRTLHRICREGLHLWDSARLTALMSYFEAALARLGVPGNELESAVRRVRIALDQTLRDPRGRWILAPSSGDARSEYALTGVENGQVVKAVIDRTFVDEQGVRWIIDFKTGSHEGAEIAAFLDREKMRYAAQLERYASLMQKRDSRPVRLGLYFPMHSGWREW
jgi:ATP-dependent helicase/nuclease subunit A